MTELQAVELIEKIDELLLLTELISDWLANISSWLTWHFSVVIPAVIILGLMFWALSQFVNRYY